MHASQYSRNPSSANLAWLLAGHTFCTTKPESFFEAAVAQEPHLHEPPAHLTSDWSAAHRSVKLLASLEPLIVVPGHGQPVDAADMPAALQELVSRFDEVSVPDNRRNSAA